MYKRPSISSKLGRVRRRTSSLFSGGGGSLVKAEGCRVFGVNINRADDLLLGLFGFGVAWKEIPR